MPGHGQPDDPSTYTAGTTPAPTTSRAASPTEERAARVRFRRALALMAMTLVLPGSAQVACGNKRVGRAALRIWFALLTLAVGCLVVAAVHHEFAFWLVSDLAALQTVRILLMALAICWAALFVDAWRIGQPLSLRMGHRRAAVGITASCASRSPRCCSSARTWSACSATSSRPCSAPAT